MLRKTCLVSALTALPLLAAPSAMADAPTSVTTNHVPLTVYAEMNANNQVGYLLTTTSDRQTGLQLSFNTLGPGTEHHVQVFTSIDPKTLTSNGNLASATLKQQPVTVTTSECILIDADGDLSCTDTTTTELLDFTVTATTPVTKYAGSEFSHQSENGKTVIAGMSKSRGGQITIHLGSRTWSFADDGYVTGSVQLSDGSYAYVSRDPAL